MSGEIWAERPASPARARQLVDLLASGAARAFRVGPLDNWAEVLVAWDSTVSAGDVAIARVEADPETGVTVSAPLATVSYAAGGGRALVHVPPGAMLSASVSGYAGSGAVRAMVTSWAEA